MFTIEDPEPGSLAHHILKDRKPTHRLWMVEDREGADPEWTELATLWPTKKGTGFTGRLGKSNVFPEGARLVILPATVRKQGDAA